MVTNLYNNLNNLGMKLFLPIIAFISPIKPLILIVGLCILIDTFFGIWKSQKNGEKFSSRRLSNLISKMVLYELCLILFFSIETFILGDIILLFINIPLFLTKIVCVTLLFVELTSISENYEKITGKSLWSYFKNMLMRGKEFKNEIEDFNKKDE